MAYSWVHTHAIKVTRRKACQSQVTLTVVTYVPGGLSRRPRVTSLRVTCGSLCIMLVAGHFRPWQQRLHQPRPYTNPIIATPHSSHEWSLGRIPRRHFRQIRDCFHDCFCQDFESVIACPGSIPVLQSRSLYYRVDPCTTESIPVLTASQSPSLPVSQPSILQASQSSGLPVQEPPRPTVTPPSQPPIFRSSTHPRLLPQTFNHSYTHTFWWCGGEQATREVNCRWQFTWPFTSHALRQFTICFFATISLLSSPGLLSSYAAALFLRR